MTTSHPTGSFKNEDIVISLETPALAGASVFVREVRVRASIDELTCWQVRIALGDQAIDFDQLLGDGAVLRAWQGSQELIHYMMVDSYEELGPGDQGRPELDLVLRLPQSVLSRQGRFRVFADMALPDVIRAIFSEAGFVEGTDFELRLSGVYEKSPDRYFAQFREDDLRFVLRLCQFFGVCVYAEHGENCKLVFADSNIHWRMSPYAAELDYVETGEKRDIFSFGRVGRTLPSRTSVLDYNYRYPGGLLEHQIDLPHGRGSGLRLYESGIASQDEAVRLAKVRAEEQVCHASHYRGRCANPMLGIGSVFTLRHHETLSGTQFQVLELSARFTQSYGESGDVLRQSFESEIIAVDAQVPVRPRRRLAAPKVDGIYHGVIVKQTDNRLGEVDEYGHYRVRMLLDDADGPAVYPVVRLMQPSLGGSYGFHFPLRENVEVLVSFIDGDPNRPVIVGAVDNGQQPIPIAGDTHTQNILRTGGNNLLHFEDEKDNERIKLETPFSETKLQLGSPNFPEAGYGLTTAGGVTSQTDTTTSTISSFANLADGAFGFSKHGNVASIAKLPEADYWAALKAFLGSSKGLSKLNDMGKSSLKSYKDTRDKVNSWTLNSRLNDQRRAQNDLNDALSEAGLDAIPDCVAACLAADDCGLDPAVKACLQSASSVADDIATVTASTDTMVSDAGKGGSEDRSTEPVAGTNWDFASPDDAVGFDSVRKEYRDAEKARDDAQDRLSKADCTACKSLPDTVDMAAVKAALSARCPKVDPAKTPADAACQADSKCSKLADTLKKLKSCDKDALKKKLDSYVNASDKVAETKAHVWSCSSGPEAVRCKMAEQVFSTASTVLGIWSTFATIKEMVTTSKLGLDQAMQWAYVTEALKRFDDRYTANTPRKPGSRFDDKTKFLIVRHANRKKMLAKATTGYNPAVPMPGDEKSSSTNILGADGGATVVYGDESTMVYGGSVILAGINKAPKGVKAEGKKKVGMTTALATQATQLATVAATGQAANEASFTLKNTLNEADINGDILVYGHSTATVAAAGTTLIRGFGGVFVESPKQVRLEVHHNRTAYDDDFSARPGAATNDPADKPTSTLDLSRDEGLVAKAENKIDATADGYRRAALFLNKKQEAELSAKVGDGPKTEAKVWCTPDGQVQLVNKTDKGEVKLTLTTGGTVVIEAPEGVEFKNKVKISGGLEVTEGIKAKQIDVETAAIQSLTALEEKVGQVSNKVQQIEIGQAKIQDKAKDLDDALNSLEGAVREIEDRDSDLTRAEFARLARIKN